MGVLRAILVCFCLYFFYNMEFQVEGALSAFSVAKARRTQSMKPLTSYKSEFESRTRNEPISSSSSDSITEIKPSDPQPIPSTSAAKRLSETNMQEVDLEPLVENSKKISSVRANLPDLQEAASVTNFGEINPARDGLYARVQSAFGQFSGAVVVGSAIGAASAVIGDQLMQNISWTNTTNLIKNKTISTLFHDVDDIKVRV